MTIPTAIKTTGLSILLSEKGKPFLLMLKIIELKIILQIVDVVQQIKYLYLLWTCDNFTAADRKPTVECPQCTCIVLHT